MKDDRPVKPIRVDPFYLDEHEVTNEQYAAFVQATKHRAPYNWPRRQGSSGKRASIPWSDVELGRRLCLRQMGGQAAYRPKPNGNGRAEAPWKV